MNIKDLRVKLNLTQQEMANSIDIERSLYNKIEGGKNNLTVEQIKSVIKIHSVNPDWILFGKGDMLLNENTPAHAPIAGCTEKIQALEEKLGDKERIISQQQDVIDSQKEVIAMLKEQLALAKNTDTKTPAVHFSTKP